LDEPREHPEFHSDASLRDRILSGDRGAAQAFLDRHLEPLYEFCHYRLGGERGRVEDVVQDTVLSALEGLAGFDARSGFHAWLCGIAKNKIRAQRRRRRPLLLEDVLAESQGEIDAILARVESEDLPEWILEERETRELVGATLSSLSPDYRRALEQKYVDGASVREMALASGKSEKAMESLLNRARTAFARVFELIAKRRGGLP
jgi:RNA polymerase sigma-70 factor (ECF subfamily)